MFAPQILDPNYKEKQECIVKDMMIVFINFLK